MICGEFIVSSAVAMVHVSAGSKRNWLRAVDPQKVKDNGPGGQVRKPHPGTFSHKLRCHRLCQCSLSGLCLTSLLLNASLQIGFLYKLMLIHRQLVTRWWFPGKHWQSQCHPDRSLADASGQDPKTPPN